ncbi:hypothetical protein SVIOM74S_06871 [Streptomyces violarus]
MCCTAFWKDSGPFTWSGSFSIWKPMMESASCMKDERREV